jgi:hypothetical protein
MSVIDAKILRNQIFIVQEFVGLACKYATAGVEDDHLIGYLERQLTILLDQYD